MADANGELDELVAATSEQDEAGSDADPAADPSQPGSERHEPEPDREASRADPDTPPPEGTDAAGRKPADEVTRKPGDGKSPDDDGLTPAEREIIDKLATKPSAAPDKPAPQTTEKPKPGDRPASSLTTEEEERLEPKTRKAFASMRTETKALRTQLAELRPLAEEGTRILAAFDKFEGRQDLQEVPEDEMVGMVRLQAALNRGERAVAAGTDIDPTDRALLERIEPVYTQVLERLGIPRSTSNSIPQPYDGFLTADHQAIIDGGFSEASLRQLIGIEEAAKKAKSEKDKPTEQRRPVAQRREAPAAAAGTRTAPAGRAPVRPDPAEQQYTRLSRSYLSERGIEGVSQNTHFSTELMPIIIKELVRPVLKNKDADPMEAFQKSKPETRHILLKRAHALFETRQAEARKRAGTPNGRQQPTRRPLTQQESAGGGTRRTPQPKNGRQESPEEELQRRLAGE